MSGRAKGTYGTIDNWVLHTAPRLPLAAGWVLLALENQSNYDRSKGLTLAGLCEATGREPDQVRRGVALLLEYGMARQAGRTYLIGSGARAAEALGRQEERKSAGIKARTNARLKETSDPDERPSETMKTTPPERQEGQESTQERECKGGSDAPAEHALAPGRGEDQLQAGQGGADRAEAPGGARSFTGSGPPQRDARTTQATRTEQVPGAAAGGAAPPDPTRSALLVAFGPVFLTQLLGESPGRQNWLALPAGRVAELHQAAIESSGQRPWRTLFISQLDLEVQPKPQNLKLDRPQEEWTREEWLS